MGSILELSFDHFFSLRDHISAYLSHVMTYAHLPVAVRVPTRVLFAPGSAVVWNEAAARCDEEMSRPDVEANWGAALPEAPPQWTSGGCKPESVFTRHRFMCNVKTWEIDSQSSLLSFNLGLSRTAMVEMLWRPWVEIHGITTRNLLISWLYHLIWSWCSVFFTGKMHFVTWGVQRNNQTRPIHIFIPSFVCL